MTTTAERPDSLPSMTYKRKVATADGTELNVYITICNHDGRPFEVFLNCSNAQLMEYLSTLMIMISRLFRHGVPPATVAEDLQGIHSPFTGHMSRSGYCPSLAACIGRVIEQHSRPPLAAPAEPRAGEPAALRQAG